MSGLRRCFSFGGSADDGFAEGFKGTAGEDGPAAGFSVLTGSGV